MLTTEIRELEAIVERCALHCEWIVVNVVASLESDEHTGTPQSPADGRNGQSWQRSTSNDSNRHVP